MTRASFSQVEMAVRSVCRPIARVLHVGFDNANAQTVRFLANYGILVMIDEQKPLQGTVYVMASTTEEAADIFGAMNGKSLPELLTRVAGHDYGYFIKN